MTMALLLFAYLLLPLLTLLCLLLLSLLLPLTIMFLLLSLLLHKFCVFPSCCRWTAPAALLLLSDPRSTVWAILLRFVLRLWLRCRGFTRVAVHNLASNDARPA